MMSDKSVHASQGYPSHFAAVLSRFRWPFLLVLCLGLWFFWPSNPPIGQEITGPIVILGDSLAAGYQVNPQEGFVALLASRLKVEITNLGKVGATTAESLPRVDQEVLPLKPGLVLVELGGNDALQKVDPQTTRANLQAIIDKIQAQQIPIVLLGVRGSLLSDKYEELFEELAQKNKVALVPNILEGILASPSLRVDSVHPNAKGHALIADRVEPILKRFPQKSPRP